MPVGRITGEIPQQSRERVSKPGNDNTKGSAPPQKQDFDKSNRLSSSPLHKTRATDFQRLRNDVKSANDEVKAVRALAEIVAEKAGRVFISQFDREDAEYCIDILGRVSRYSRLQRSFVFSDIFVRASQGTTSKPPSKNRVSLSR